MFSRRYLLTFVAAQLFLQSLAFAQVERIWLTHRSTDPSKMVINWTTKEPGDSVVRYGRTNRYGQEVRSDENTTLHQVEIPIPERDKAYHYRVSTGDETSSDATFKAYPTDVLRVAVAADWQRKPDLSAIMKDDVHLLLTAGDNISSIHQRCGAGNKDCIKPYAELIDRYPDLFRSMPFMPVLGNHDKEIRPRGSKPPEEPVYDIDATAFRRFFELPDDEWKWHFDIPDFDVRFVALDLNHISDFGTTWQACHSFKKGSEQFEWYRKVIDDTMKCNLPLIVTLATTLTTTITTLGNAAEKPIKTFICAGQSNMVGYGDSTELPDDLRKGNDRVLMFENGKWQPLRPHKPAIQGQRRLGLTEFSFGPEIAFGHEMAKAFPDETIGIIKHAAGGTSLLAWKPDWNKADAARVGQVGRGPLYKQLMEKVQHASKARDIEIVGFLWLQGGGDMKKADVAKEYLDNLKAFVAAIRKDTGVADMPFIYGSPRIEGIPDDLTGFKPPQLPPGRPGAWLVLKAQFDAQKEIPHSKMVILRDIEKHPRNVHYNTAGQLEVGRLFAEAFLDHVGQGFKVYISTDMEGCSGVTCSEQVAGEEGRQLMTGDMNACIEGCFAAGATEVVIRDHHSSGSNVDPQAIDKRAKLIQGKTPENRFKDIEGSDAMILLGYHAMALTPNGTLAHSFSSASIQGMWLNGREVGEIGVDAAIAAEYKVPVVMVSGDDKCCAEAQSWLPGAVTCQTKVGTGPQSADVLPLEESRRLITQKTKEALDKRKEISPIKIKYPATIRWDYLPKGSPRTHNPAFNPVDNPRRVEKTGDSVEALLIGK